MTSDTDDMTCAYIGTHVPIDDNFREDECLSELKNEQSFFFENVVPKKIVVQNQVACRKPNKNPIQGRSY